MFDYHFPMADRERNISESENNFTNQSCIAVNVPGEPQNLKVSAVSPSSVKVNWDPPANENGPITKYKLIYYMVGCSTVICLLKQFRGPLHLPMRY